MQHQTQQVPHPDRRGFLVSSACAAALGAGGWIPLRAAEPSAAAKTVKYCLNTSTIRGHKLPLEREIELVADAGYDGIEVWIGEIQQYQQMGGKLDELKKRLDDRGLTVESAIGFARWIVDDPNERAKGLENLRRDMELVKAIGGSRIAAPPSGATDQPLDLLAAAERYAAACEIGAEIGVNPQLELWGFSKTLSRMGELMFVAVESGHPRAGLLLDIYHIYKGQSDFQGLELINAKAVEVLHMNDYPDIPAATIKDADRVYPGDGVAPVGTILQTLFANGFSGVLSLELFNPEYWKQDVQTVLNRGLASMKASVADIGTPS